MSDFIEIKNVLIKKQDIYKVIKEYYPSGYTGKLKFSLVINDNCINFKTEEEMIIEYNRIKKILIGE